MKILTLHCDYIKFKPLKKALKQPEELSKEREKEIEVKEPLVVLTAVEKGDNADILRQMVEAVKTTAKEVKAKNIVLYPYAHLSSNLGAPELALEMLKKADESLSADKALKVTRAPFGYYKEFELKCKGHPLSELSKSFGVVDGKVVEEKYDAAKLIREISKAKLDTSKLKDNDHRILGQKLDLFSFHDVAPGMVFFHSNGLTIYNELAGFWREMHKKDNYKEVRTPQVLDKKLWQISGHWEKYKNNIFLTQYEGREFAVKPMSCPGGLLIYKSTPKSYRDLPLRVGELGVVHRQELSGVLAGLFRVIQFTQDDAHIFCTEQQIESEVSKLISLVDLFYKKFSFSYAVELSTRPEKRIGSDEIWDKAEAALENVLKKNKIKYKLNKGDGAFYGPKIDFHLTDSLGRTWQCGTIQLDFSMPERFELEYTDSENGKKRPVMIHNAIYGSIERFMGVLLEHLNGNLPLWLSPIQVRVLDFTDRNTKAAEKVVEQIQKEIPMLRIDTDFKSTTINDKVRDAEMMKVPYVLVIGDKEEESKTIAVRERGNAKPKFKVKLDSFIKELKDKLESRT